MPNSVYQEPSIEVTVFSEDPQTTVVSSSQGVCGGDAPHCYPVDNV